MSCLAPSDLLHGNPRHEPRVRRGVLVRCIFNGANALERDKQAQRLRLASSRRQGARRRHGCAW
jgi:hypothetical protein